MELATIRQHLASLICSLAAFSVGTAFVWYAPLMLYIESPESPIQMTTTESSWLVTSMEIGCLIFALPAGLLSDTFGRKYLVLIVGPVSALMYLLTAYVRSLHVLYFIRLVQGFCMGVVYTVGSIYTAEIAEPHLRGSTTCHIQTLFFAGGLFAYLVGPYVDYETYALLCLGVPLLFTAAFAAMPESPYYLLMKGEKEEAGKALSWLRAKGQIDEELKSIEDTVQREYHDEGSWKELFLTKKDRKAFLIVQLCCVTRYLTGMSPFSIYVSKTFGKSTTSYLDHNQLTIATGVLMTIASFISCLVSDAIGRRPLLIYSCTITFICNVVIGAYFFFDFKTDFDVSPFAWALYVAVAGYIISANVGLEPLLQTIQAEFFSVRTRGIGGGLTLIVGSTFNSLSIKQYQFVEDIAGVYLNYLSYALASLIGAVCMYLFLPETTGRSLGQIQKDFSQET